MANHVRQQLREAAATALTGLTTTATRVYTSRIRQLQDTNLPALRVYTTEETVEAATIHGPTLQERAITLEVHGVAKATNDVDDTLDTIAKEVETVLAGGLTVGGKSIRIGYAGAVVELEGEGERTRGQVTMTFTATVFTAANAPDVAL